MPASSLKRPASAMESDREVRWQIAKLLKVKPGSIGSLRKTEDRKIPLIDVIGALTGKGKHESARILKALSQNSPEVMQRTSLWSIPGAREISIADSATMVEIIMLLPGSIPANLRIEASKLLTDYLGEESSLVDEEASGEGGSDSSTSSSLSELRAEFAAALEATKAEFNEALARLTKEIQEAVKDLEEVAREVNTSLNILIAD